MKTTTFIHHSVIVFALATAAQPACLVDAADLSEVEALVEWVRSKPGGFVSSKVEIRHMDPSDMSSPFGVYANDDIQEDERILEVPQECYLSLPDEEVEPVVGTDMDALMPVYYRNTCRLAQLMQRELELGPERSVYGPFIAYLQSQRPGQIPATWSKAGKALLVQVLGGDNIPPGKETVDWIDNNFKNNGCIDSENKFQEHVVAMAIQRGYDTTLIPIWDMVNHANGKQNNLASNSMFEGIKVWASKPIAKDEELFASYNFCTDCDDVGDDWGTPGILRDFGFVEPYPHVWNFEEREIYFRIDEEEESEIRQNRNVTYYPDDDGTPGVPTKEDLTFLSDERERLNRMLTIVDDRQQHSAVPEHEWATIRQFVHVARDDFSSAIFAVSQHHGLTKDEL